MSHAGTILGITELEIEQIHRCDEVKVWAKPNRRPLCKHCHSKRLRIKATHSRTVKHTRQGNQIMTLYLKLPKYHCRDCGRYFRHPFVGILPRYRASECYRLEVFEAHHGGVTQRKISRTHNIIAATVERWYQAHVSQKYKETISRPCPEILGIDEHFLREEKAMRRPLWT